jgi:hypothetical protein
MLKNTQQLDEQLDRLGRHVLQAAAGDEAEVESAAAAPFLFTRVRAAIAEEERRRTEAGSWLSMLFVARRAVPAMALITILAILTVLSAQFRAVKSANFDEDALFGTPGPGVEQTVLAGRGNLSQDDIFNIVLDREYGRGAR